MASRLVVCTDVRCRTTTYFERGLDCVTPRSTEPSASRSPSATVATRPARRLRIVTRSPSRPPAADTEITTEAVESDALSLSLDSDETDSSGRISTTCGPLETDELRSLSTSVWITGADSNVTEPDSSLVVVATRRHPFGPRRCSVTSAPATGLLSAFVTTPDTDVD